MNRKTAGAALGALLLVVVAVWFFALRDRGNGAKSPSKQARTGKLELPRPTQAKGDGAVPQGIAPRWSLDIDPEGPLRLEGQVVDEDGRGVGGAEVWLSSVPPRSAKSDDDGTFTFDKLVGRSYSLTATRGDLIGGPVTSRLTEASDPIVIRLGQGAQLVVTVSGDDGKPIANADVKLTAEHTARTAADGVATIKPVHPGWVVVEVSATGYAPGNGFTQIGSAGATGHVEVKLHKGVAVSGRVVDDAGKPLAKVHVTTSSVFDLPSGVEPVVTDAKGQFTFAALASGSQTLAATDGEHAPARSAPITVADRPVTGIEIVMKPGGSIAGVVVDETGKVAAYASVRVAGEGARMWTTESRQATSDGNGAFELRGLSRTRLQIRAESYTAASKIVDIDLTSEAARKGLRLVLDVKGMISGIVVDEKGKAVPEVQVNAFPDLLGGASAEGLALAGMSSTSTDGGGAFAIRGIPEGAYRLWAARSSVGTREWGEQGVKAKTGDRNVRITLAAPGLVIGKLVLENGNPPKLANVTIGHHPNTPASADGTFKITDVAPGNYDLRAVGPEFAEFIQRDVEIKTGQTTDLGKLTLVRGRKLVGKVIDSHGNAVAGAKVKVGDMLFSIQGAEERMDAVEQMSGGHSTTSDQDGRFTLVGLAKKETNVMADHATRGRSPAVEIPAGTDDPPPVTLTLKGYGSIMGKVTSKGAAVSGATITDTPKGGGIQVQIAQSGDDGTFTIQKAAEGTHVLSAMQQSGFGMSLKSTSVTVQIQEGRQATANIDIPVGSLTLTVDIKPQAGQKVDAAQVFVFRGTVAVHNAKELTEGFLGGGVQGMKFWWGPGKPAPEFDELVAGLYSACAIPITGDLSDATFQSRLQEHKDALKVYCKVARLESSPAKQSVAVEVPAMAPLPQN